MSEKTQSYYGENNFSGCNLSTDQTSFSGDNLSTEKLSSLVKLRRTRENNFSGGNLRAKKISSPGGNLINNLFSGEDIFSIPTKRKISILAEREPK